MSVLTATRFGRYELRSELARGGMAVLHLARLSGLGGFSKQVAIKLMLPHLSENPSYVELFLNEGRIAARISHPNVCQVFEIGEVDGQLFLAMEYLDGVTWEHLARVLPADPTLKLRAITGVLAQACDGLQHAHDHRDANGAPAPVIHRDISPQNLFVTVDGVCKVLDFGIAKIATETSRTRTGALKGKVPYMSPEQLRGESLDTRSDVFATGVVLWEALANRPLFVREVEFQTWKAITEDKIDPISAWEPQFGADVDAVVMRALERDRNRRYTEIRELGDALRRLGASYGGAFTPAEIGDLVRTTCAPQLEARERTITEFDDGAPVPPNAAIPTGIALRANTVALGHEAPPRRWPKRVAIGLAAAAIAATVLVLAWPSDNPQPVARIGPPASAPATPVGEAAAPVFLPSETMAVAETPKSRNKPRARDNARERARPVRPPHEPPPPVMIAGKPGRLSVDARPSARVYIDGRFVDETPLYRTELTAGRHEVRIVPVDGKPKIMRVTIEPDKVLNLGTIQ